MDEKPRPWTVPEPTPDGLETERLTLRQYVHEDAERLFAAVNASRDMLQPWLPWVHGSHETIHNTHYHIEDLRHKQKGLLNGGRVVLGVFLRESGELVGGCGFHGVDAANSKAEIGYWTSALHVRRGYALEAARWLASWMMTPQGRIYRGGQPGWGFRRVEIRCAGENAASRRVAERMGFWPEVHRRQSAWLGGHGWQDEVGFGMLAECWDVVAHAPREAGRSV